jgi:3-oxoacyl-[acyl-carrier-protein] synthase II
VTDSIVITGMGAVAANGAGVEPFWQACLAGRSGIAPMRFLDPTGLPVPFGGEVDEPPLGEWIDVRTARQLDVSQRVGIAAAVEAWEDARLGSMHHAPESIAVLIGTGAGPQSSLARHVRDLDAEGPLAVPPHHGLMHGSGAASAVARVLGTAGPCFGVSASCATGAASVAAAAAILLAREADVVLAGGVDVIRSAALLAAFANMRTLARHDEPTRASRPLDLRRNGFVVSEGAGVLVLERGADAIARGARVRARLAGWGLGRDDQNLIASGPEGLSRAVGAAMRRAPGGPIDQLSLHAAGTRRGDQAEADGLRTALGPEVCTIPATAPKSLVGHAMGAAAALETILAVRTLETGLVPPTANLDEPDPAIALDASREPREARVRRVLKTSSGLGGLHAALVLDAAGG